MRLNITDAVKHILIINVIMFIGTVSIGNGQTFYDWFALYFPKNPAFEPWQIITHMFMHGGGAHLFFNMFALWMFGTSVERQIGTKRFLFIYFSAGLGAVLFQLGYYYVNFLPDYNSLIASGVTPESINQMFETNRILPGITEVQLQQLRNIAPSLAASMVGASGCIMGVLAAFGMMNPNAELMLIFFPIPIKAKYFIPGIIILDVISAITGQSFFSPSNTAYMAHVGGAVVGFLIMWYWKKNSMDKYRWN
ncbi:membrane associated rhomboid family serine protease [Winogradskyella wandonensis]|uniref:Membrane associated rhomboid family serine protease n=1 Tax=Winogradskyella wandonensis TaxID=1442586 RepID=A0A4R1KQC9_9FLAO|nr:rhomboid family intramembrane serine protease [Winogradskyella wandonensis]TCK66707.1 membrane associated rhomboid family serine protease [Winogradskyella wandonensis]